jgi:glucosamine kinase
VPGLPVLGVEATSLGTQAVLVRDGEVLNRVTEGPLNVLLDPNAFDRLVHLIKESGASTAGLGLAGLQRARDVQLLEAQLRAKTGVAVTVADDTEVAQLGAFNGAPGIVVIAHTGSNAFGRDAAGRAVRAGGMGHIVGDEGSHYWIAAEAIRLAIRSRDGRGVKSPGLEHAVTSAYGVNLDGLMVRVTESSADPSLIARLARTVMNLEEPVMQVVLDQATADLIAHVTAVRAELGQLPVAMYGAVFSHPYIRQRFMAATGAVDAAATPVYGAVVLATSRFGARDMGWRND